MLPPYAEPYGEPDKSQDARMRLTRLSIAIVLLSAATAHAQAPAPSEPKFAPVHITWDQKIPMRDGIKLSAAIPKAEPKSH